MSALVDTLMGAIYAASSGILLFWHAAWHRLFGDAPVLGTNWSWVLGIVFLVLTVRAMLFPLFVKQIRSQRAMQELQPRVKALQEKHKDDRESLQKELLELYRSEKANPLMGCLPMVVQIPVFLGLFHVLRHLKPTMPEHLKTLYGWTVAQFDSASSAKLFGAPIAASFGRSTPQELSLLNADGTTVQVVAAILIVAMIGTTFLTSRQMILKAGWADDPQQKLVQRLMLYGVPFSLLISGLIFPIGVIIYWVTTNLFSLGQQTWVLRRYPPTGSRRAGADEQRGEPEATAEAGDGRDSPVKPPGPKVGAKPVNPKKGGAAKR